MNTDEFIEKFKRAMIDNGITPPLELITDGQHHHFKTESGEPAFYGVSTGPTKGGGVFSREWTGNFGVGSTLVQINSRINYGENSGVSQCH